MNEIKLWHILLFAVVNTSATIAGFEYLNSKKIDVDIPKVVIDSTTGQCIEVVNYRNGDAYDCSDVNAVLRNYNRTVVSAKTYRSGDPDTSTPVSKEPSAK